MWKDILKQTVRPREKMDINMFQYKHRDMMDNMEAVMPEINELTNLYKTEQPEFEANTETTLWLIDKYLANRKKMNIKNADTVTLIKEVIRDLTDNLKHGKGRYTNLKRRTQGRGL